MSAIDVNETACLIMDYQNRIVADYGAGDPELTKRASSVLDAARGAGIPVIHVVVRFRPGHAEVADDQNETSRQIPAVMSEPSHREF